MKMYCTNCPFGFMHFPDVPNTSDKQEHQQWMDSKATCDKCNKTFTLRDLVR